MFEPRCRTLKRCAALSKIAARESTPLLSLIFLIASLRRKRPEWEWVCPSPVRSLKHMVVGFESKTTLHSAEPASASTCQRTVRVNRGRGAITLLAMTGGQYGGGLRCRCIFAASIHHVRSSAKRGNALSRALPPSPIGAPSAARLCAMGPTAIVLDTTTIPISESVPCQAVAARAPEIRPPE